MCSIKDIQPSLLGDLYKLEASQLLLKHYKKHYFSTEAGGGVVWIMAKQRI
jgi:hypothetical protein